MSQQPPQNGPSPPSNFDNGLDSNGFEDALAGFQSVPPGNPPVNFIFYGNNNVFNFNMPIFSHNTFSGGPHIAQDLTGPRPDVQFQPEYAQQGGTPVPARGSGHMKMARKIGQGTSNTPAFPFDEVSSASGSVAGYTPPVPDTSDEQKQRRIERALKQLHIEK